MKIDVLWIPAARSFALLPLLLACLGLAGCGGKDSTKPGSEFSDELTLGTGIAGFDLVAESTAFHGAPATISFRLESGEDFQGSAIEIRLEKNSGGGYASYRNITFPSLQDYGHIYLSSFSIDTTGQFRAVGLKASSGRVIASREFTIS